MAMEMTFGDTMFRQRVIAQIDAAREGLSEEECNKTSEELENFLYGNANNRDEYMQLIATLVLHFNDKKRNARRNMGIDEYQHMQQYQQVEQYQQMEQYQEVEQYQEIEQKQQESSEETEQHTETEASSASNS